MILTTVVFALEVVNVHVRLLAADRSLWSPRRWLRGLGYLWLRPGLLRTLIKPYLAYYKPSFHPAERNVDALIATTRERLFGPGGALEGKVREVWSKQVEVAA
jgi:predicted metal-dependent hydrolase